MSDNRFESLVLQLDNYDGPGVYMMGDVPKEEQEAAKGTNAYKCGWNDSLMENIAPFCDMVAKAKEGMSDDRIMLLASGHFDLCDGLLHMNMSDTWGWATAWLVPIADEQVEEVARLFGDYGYCGLLYWHSHQEDGMKSEFHDINRRVEFVANEERIKAEFPESNKRAYHKASYQLGT